MPGCIEYIGNVQSHYSCFRRFAVREKLENCPRSLISSLVGVSSFLLSTDKFLGTRGSIDQRHWCCEP